MEALAEPARAQLVRPRDHPPTLLVPIVWTPCPCAVDRDVGALLSLTAMAALCRLVLQKPIPFINIYRLFTARWTVE
jgi:hypothetical protein